MNYIELFAGVGGMSMGLDRAGFHPVALVEWDRAAAGVLAHRFPDVPLYCDVTKFTGEEVGDARVDLLAFGSPCQDLSVAGKRAGMTKNSNTRSSLFHDAIRIANRLRIHNGLRFLLWENVVGALSSNQGADFAAVLGEMVDLGARDVAWACLDSQWFGVPQRRRRVFVVADFGGECAAEILSLAEGMSGNPPPSREAGEGFTHPLAPSLTASGRGVERGGDTRGQDPVIAVGAHDICPATANTLTRRMHKGVNSDLNEGQTLVAASVTGSLACSGGKAYPGTTAQDAGEGFLVAHTLRGEGFDASEDGTGRGTPLVADSFPWMQGGAMAMQVDRELCGTLVKNQHPAVHVHEPAVAFAQNQAGELRTSAVVGTLGTNSNASGRATPMVQAPQSGVRRLTPTECERLQGWPESEISITCKFYLDPQKSYARVDQLNLRSPKHVGGAEATKSPEVVASAEIGSPLRHPKNNAHVDLVVRINLERKSLQILSPSGRCLFLASDAELFLSNGNPVQAVDFVHGVAAALEWLVRKRPDGKAAPQQSEKNSIDRMSGNSAAEKYGHVSEGSASDVETSIRRKSPRLKSTTSKATPSTPTTEQTLKTWLSSVCLATSSFILPTTSRESGYEIEVILHGGHTLYRRDLVLDGNRWHVKPDSPVREQADGPRYKQCGNGVTSNVAFYIASRIVRFSK